MVSVAMVTYNHAPFIAQAIESVLMQETAFGVELVIGEDCSTDGTREIVQEYHRRYPGRIRLLLRDTNLGPSKNMKGVYAACLGRYTAILEGDDYWTSPAKLQMQVDYLESHPECVLCCHRVRYIYEDKSQEAHGFRDDVRAGVYELGDVILDFFVKTCSILVPTKYSQNLPAWCSETFIGDWPLVLLAARNGNICLLDEYMADYRVHHGGSWSGGAWEGRWAAKTKLAEHLLEALPRRHANAVRNVIFRGYYLRALDRLKRADMVGARGFASRCLTSTPPWYETRAKSSLLVEAFMPPVYRVIRGWRGDRPQQGSAQ
jgi:glycosyltransferase involved in cell wall biosynthesis